MCTWNSCFRSILDWQYYILKYTNVNIGLVTSVQLVTSADRHILKALGILEQRHRVARIIEVYVPVVLGMKIRKSAGKG